MGKIRAISNNPVTTIAALIIFGLHVALYLGYLEPEQVAKLTAVAAGLGLLGAKDGNK